MMKLILTGTIIATFATLQGCGVWAINNYPELVTPVDPASLNFEHIDRATGTIHAVTIVELRRVERGVHIVFAIERPSDIDQPYGFMIASDLEHLQANAIELVDSEGKQVSLRERKREVIQLPFFGPNCREAGPCLTPVPGRDRLYVYETRFRTERTLADGTYRVRVIPSEFPKTPGVPMNVNADQKVFTPALVPPIPEPD